jgi:hypothetical protein
MGVVAHLFIAVYNTHSMGVLVEILFKIGMSLVFHTHIMLSMLHATKTGGETVFIRKPWIGT